jgi:hypothetical protein
MRIPQVYTDEQGRQYTCSIDLPPPVGRSGMWTRSDRHPRKWRTYLDETNPIVLPAWLIPFLIGMLIGVMLGRVAAS